MRTLILGLSAVLGGTRTYLANLLPALRSAAPEDEFVLLVAPWQRELRESLEAAGTDILVGGPRSRSQIGRMRFEQVELPRIIRSEGFDVVYTPSEMSSLAADRPTVAAFRNANVFAPLEHQRLDYRLRNTLLRGLAALTVRKAATIVVVSEYSKRALCAAMSVDPDHVRVVYHGVGPRFFEQPDDARPLRDFGGPYILTVSTIASHKNYVLAIRSFAELARRDPALQYVVVGAVGCRSTLAAMQREIAVQRLGGRVHMIGELPNAELPAIYRNAELMFFPSLRETFGHPLVEAMASGTPVVASRRTAIPEVLGRAAELFDPESVTSAVQALNRVLSDPPYRSCLRERGLERARDFSWERSARLLHGVLTDAAMSRNGAGVS